MRKSVAACIVLLVLLAPFARAQQPRVLLPEPEGNKRFYRLAAGAYYAAAYLEPIPMYVAGPFPNDPYGPSFLPYQYLVKDRKSYGRYSWAAGLRADTYFLNEYVYISAGIGRSRLQYATSRFKKPPFNEWYEIHNYFSTQEWIEFIEIPLSVGVSIHPGRFRASLGILWAPSLVQGQEYEITRHSYTLYGGLYSMDYLSHESLQTTRTNNNEIYEVPNTIPFRGLEFQFAVRFLRCMEFRVGAAAWEQTESLNLTQEYGNWYLGETADKKHVQYRATSSLHINIM